MARPKPVVLTRPDQLRAVTSLVAHQVISVMERVRSATVTELAERIGVRAGSLYYHVRNLKRAGVLVEQDRRSTGGRQEVVYELAGSEVVLDSGNAQPAFLGELARTVRSRLRMVERLYLDALARRGSARRVRGLSLHHHHSRLSAKSKIELERRIEELEAFLIDNDDPRVKEFTHVTLAVLPVVRE